MTQFSVINVHPVLPGFATYFVSHLYYGICRFLISEQHIVLRSPCYWPIIHVKSVTHNNFYATTIIVMYASMA